MFATFPVKDGLFSIVMDSVAYDTGDKSVAIQIPVEYRERVVKQLCEQYGAGECDSCGAISSDVEAVPTSGSSGFHPLDPAYDARDLCRVCREQRSMEISGFDDMDMSLQSNRSREYQEAN